MPAIDLIGSFQALSIELFGLRAAFESWATAKKKTFGDRRVALLRAFSESTDQLESLRRESELLADQKSRLLSVLESESQEESQLKRDNESLQLQITQQKQRMLAMNERCSELARKIASAQLAVQKESRLKKDNAVALLPRIAVFERLLGIKIEIPSTNAIKIAIVEDSNRGKFIILDVSVDGDWKISFASHPLSDEAALMQRVNEEKNILLLIGAVRREFLFASQ